MVNKIISGNKCILGGDWCIGNIRPTKKMKHYTKDYPLDNQILENLKYPPL